MEVIECIPKCPYCDREIKFADFFNKKPKLDRKGEAKNYKWEFNHAYEIKQFSTET